MIEYYDFVDGVWAYKSAYYVVVDGSSYPLGSIPATFWTAARKPATPKPEYNLATQILDGPRDLGDGTVGYVVRNLTTEEIRARLPDRVTMRQARIYLSRAGLLATIEANIQAMGGEAIITWQYSQEVQRSNPLVAAMGFTEVQLDQMFTDASKL